MAKKAKVKFAYTLDIFEIKDISFTVKDLYDQVRQVQDVYDISSGKSLYILDNCNWDIEKAQDPSNFDMEQVYVTQDEKLQKLQNSNECLLCFEPIVENKYMALTCNHRFCDDCWPQYLSQVLTEGTISISKSCMQEDCKEYLTFELFQKYCNQNQMKKFEKYLFDHSIFNSTMLIACPSAGCDNILSSKYGKSIRDRKYDLMCNCGFFFCNLCSEPAHKPLSCANLKSWQKITTNNSELANEQWMKENTKNCTKCKVAIQKNQGCNHMTCRNCKHDFCWICNRDWKMGSGENSHDDYFNCKFKGDVVQADIMSDPNAQNIKFLVQWADIFDIHTRNLKEFKEKKASLKQQFNEQLKSECERFSIDTQFYYNLLDLALEAKYAMLYCAPVGYFNDITKNAIQELFKFQYGSLELYLDSVIKEVSLDQNMIDQFKSGQGDMDQSFHDYRKKCTILDQNLSNYFANLLEGFQDQIAAEELKLTKKISSKKMSKNTSKPQFNSFEEDFNDENEDDFVYEPEDDF